MDSIKIVDVPPDLLDEYLTLKAGLNKRSTTRGKVDTTFDKRIAEFLDKFERTKRKEKRDSQKKPLETKKTTTAPRIIDLTDSSPSDSSESENSQTSPQVLPIKKKTITGGKPETAKEEETDPNEEALKVTRAQYSLDDLGITREEASEGLCVPFKKFTIISLLGMGANGVALKIATRTPDGGLGKYYAMKIQQLFRWAGKDPREVGIEETRIGHLLTSLLDTKGQSLEEVWCNFVKLYSWSKCQVDLIRLVRTHATQEESDHYGLSNEGNVSFLPGVQPSMITISEFVQGLTLRSLVLMKMKYQFFKSMNFASIVAQFVGPLDNLYTLMKFTHYDAHFDNFLMEEILPKDAVNYLEYELDGGKKKLYSRMISWDGKYYLMKMNDYGLCFAKITDDSGKMIVQELTTGDVLAHGAKGNKEYEGSDPTNKTTLDKPNILYDLFKFACHAVINYADLVDQDLEYNKENPSKPQRDPTDRACLMDQNVAVFLKACIRKEYFKAETNQDRVDTFHEFIDLHSPGRLPHKPKYHIGARKAELLAKLKSIREYGREFALQFFEPPHNQYEIFLKIIKDSEVFYKKDAYNFYMRPSNRVDMTNEDYDPDAPAPKIKSMILYRKGGLMDFDFGQTVKESLQFKKEQEQEASTKSKGALSTRQGPHGETVIVMDEKKKDNGPKPFPPKLNEYKLKYYEYTYPMCDYCNFKQATKVCSHCNKKHYCSKVCQIKDWYDNGHYKEQ